MEKFGKFEKDQFVFVCRYFTCLYNKARIGSGSTPFFSNLEIDGGEAEGEVLEPVATHVQHVQLSAVANLGRQLDQPILAQGEHAQVHQVAHLGGQKLQPVPVQVQVGQLGQVACEW